MITCAEDCNSCLDYGTLSWDYFVTLMKTVDSVCCGLLQVWSSQIKDTETIFVYIIYILLFLKSNQNFYLFIKLFEHFRVQTSLSAGQERNQPQFLLLTCIYSEWSQPLPCPQSFNKTSLLRSADNPSRLSLFFSVPFLCWCSVCLWLVSALSLSLTHTHAHTHTHTHTHAHLNSRKYHLPPSSET